MNNFCSTCVSCGGVTSKSYARTHGGKCKQCATGVAPRSRGGGGLICPDCGEPTLTRYQRDHGYHCDNCTRDTDPIGWAREMSTPQEPPEPMESSCWYYLYLL